MKNTLLLLLLLFVPVVAHAQTLEEMSNEQLLDYLDDVIAHKLDYREAYQSRIDSMKHCATSQPEPMRAETLKKIYKAYLPLQSDSALNYLNRMEELPMAKTDRDYADMIRIGRAHAYGVMGLYNSAATLLRDVHVNPSNSQLLLYYYQTCRTVYGWMADFGEMSGQKGYYEELTQKYRDSILVVQPHDINRIICEADNLYVKGDLERGLQLCRQQYASADSLQRCYLAFNMAQASKALGRTDDEVKYLAIAAILDLKRGITEYSALLKLAVALYERDDIDRAYSYLICTIQDATFGKARLRSFEASEVFPLIEDAYYKNMSERRSRTRCMSIVFGFLTICLIGILAYSRRRNRMLAKVYADLDSTMASLKDVNEALRKVNESLVESNRAKETCLARYLERCRIYLDTMDAQRKYNLRLLKAHKIEELGKELRSDALITREEESFYADFDEAFITLFPDFVTHFNALLQPDAQITPKHEEMLNTELRIFALIRLGINDSNRIAHFLNYSLPTIYSYRSRIRNKSIYSREEFDAKVLEC